MSAVHWIWKTQYLGKENPNFVLLNCFAWFFCLLAAQDVLSDAGLLGVPTGVTDSFLELCVSAG